jgi:uncharacterized protein (DUF1697 family)
MPEKNVIFFTRNEKDQYFRKSTEFASADVTLKEDKKSSGSVERLSATILKGVQDELFSIARQREIGMAAQALYLDYCEIYKESFIKNFIKKTSKGNKSRSSDLIEEDAQRLYAIKKKNIDALAEKKAWRETITQVVTDDELIFRFDAKAILNYAKVMEVKSDRLYEDVKKVQEKFNNWTEKKFNVEKGIIEEVEENGVLFPHSRYTPGSDAQIEIIVSRQMIHMILFLSKSYLKFHLDSYIAISTPNAIRLYEIIIDYISGNLFVSGRDLTLDYLQKKFNTGYKQFGGFIRDVVVPSLNKINSELNTNITYEHDKKKGKTLYSIKFVISEYDRKVLQGIRDEVIEETELVSFEYYLTLVSLGGRKAQGGLRTIYEGIRSLVNKGEFDFFNKTREEAYEDFLQNISDSEELEFLIRDEPILSDRYVYDRNYMNIIDKKDLAFVGSTATESLEYIKSSYLVAMGVLSPTLPYFTSHADEKEKIAKVLPLYFKLTKIKTIIIDNSNYDSLKMTIEPCLGDVNRFDFKTREDRMIFCETFKIEDGMEELPSIEAEVVEENNNVVEAEPQGLHELLQRNGMAKTKAELKKWDTVVEELGNVHGAEDVTMAITFLLSGTKDAEFWLKQIPTPAKFKKHFISVVHISKVDKASIMQKIKSDPQIKTRIMMMENAGQTKEEIEAEVALMIQKGFESGSYGATVKEAPWIIKNREKRAEGEMMAEAMKEAGFSSIFDWMKSLSN